MPLQNRVNPFGVIFRSPARGTFMGNRGGALHDDQREIIRSYKSRCWLACVLEFNGRHRIVMSPRRYTELFFLDEAVAFSAGHRPCAECRRRRFNAFKEAWSRAHGNRSPLDLRAAQIDLTLHQARMDSRKRQLTYDASLQSLPNGCFVALDGNAFLVSDDALLLWTPEQYTRKIPRVHGLTVTVLTPRPIVECFRHGYQPEIHYSARAI